MKIKDIKLENSLWSAQLTIVSDDRQELERIFENAGKVDPEKEYTVKIEPRRKKRTLDANAYMWQLLNKLAEKKGNAVRMPLGQLKWLLEMCDEHYDNIKFAVPHIVYKRKGEPKKRP